MINAGMLFYPAFIAGMPGGGEVLLFLLIVLIVCGPRRLPGMARSIGRVLGELRRAAEDFKLHLMAADDPPPAAGAHTPHPQETATPPPEDNNDSA